MADTSGTGADATGGSDEAPAPLTDKEIALVKRLFSDPFSIPLEFKAWLVAYLETNPPLLTAASIFGFRSTVQQQIAAAQAGVPIAAIMQYYGTVDPPDQTDWLLMDNRLMDRTAFPLLFARIGFSGSWPTPGVDPGANKFYLPEGRGMVLAGKGTNTDVDTIGKNDGNALANRSPKHNSTLNGFPNMDVFNHAASSGSAGAAGGDRNLLNPSVSVGPGGSRPTDTPSFLVVNHIMYAPG
jgi:hypothetical protein